MHYFGQRIAATRLCLVNFLHLWSFQLRAAAHAVGEVDLEKKFEAGSESLRRGIMFANSLYL